MLSVGLMDDSAIEARALGVIGRMESARPSCFPVLADEAEGRRSGGVRDWRPPWVASRVEDKCEVLGDGVGTRGKTSPWASSPVATDEPSHTVMLAFEEPPGMPAINLDRPGRATSDPALFPEGNGATPPHDGVHVDHEMPTSNTSWTTKSTMDHMLLGSTILDQAAETWHGGGQEHLETRRPCTCLPRKW